MEFSREEYWNGLPFPPSEGLPNLGIKLVSRVSPPLAGRFFTSESPGNPTLPSIKFSPSGMSDCLWAHGLQDARPPCPSPTPRVYSNSCPLNHWCDPTILFSVIPFSSCLQSFPASGSFSNESFLCIRWSKYWSFSFSISPSSKYSRLISFRLDWLDLLAVQETLNSLL